MKKNTFWRWKSPVVYLQVITAFSQPSQNSFIFSVLQKNPQSRVEASWCDIRHLMIMDQLWIFTSITAVQLDQDPDNKYHPMLPIHSPQSPDSFPMISMTINNSVRVHDCTTTIHRCMTLSAIAHAFNNSILLHFCHYKQLKHHHPWQSSAHPQYMLIVVIYNKVEKNPCNAKKIP